MSKLILVIAAHPDDEVLGCGATIAKHALEGDKVCCLILGEGITSRYDQRGDASRKKLKQLKSEAKQATQILGVKKISFRDFPDNRFDSVPLLDIVKVVEDFVSKLQPDVIYTHHGGDLNIDHQIVHRAVLTAARPLENCPVKEIYTFEVPSSTEWAFQQFEPAFHPNVFVDITETLEIKVQALQIYESEARPFPHPRSPEALRAIARRWGSVVGLEAAEAFQLVRSIR
ncbi:MAG: PIG-L family deacetylase [Dehalococcoidia bacterium]|nr:PIG-L family deacetylase [Dehalococcoidia bacterium]